MKQIEIFTNFAISVNFEDTKMVDHILKISRPDVLDVVCLSWNTAIIVCMRKCRMDRRRYKSRHWIPMFIGTPCSCQGRTRALEKGSTFCVRERADFFCVPLEDFVPLKTSILAKVLISFISLLQNIVSFILKLLIC